MTGRIPGQSRSLQRIDDQGVWPYMVGKAYFAMAFDIEDVRFFVFPKTSGDESHA